MSSIFGFERDSFRRYFFNTSWLFFERFFRLSLGLLVGVLVARYLEPIRYGSLSYAQSLISLLIPLSAFGIDNVAIREIVSNPNEEHKYLGSALVLRLLGASIAFSIIYIIAMFSDMQTKTLLLILSILYFVNVFKIFNAYFQAKVMSKYHTLSSIFALSISSVVKLSLIYTKASVYSFAFVVVIENVLLVIGYAYFFKKMSVSRLKISTQVILKYIKDSWPLILSGMIVSVYMRVDQIMLRYILGDEVVGNYAAAVRLSEAWYFISVMISTSVFPSIVNTRKRNAMLYEDRMKKLYALLILVAILIAVPSSILSSHVIHFTYGDSFSLASQALSIHIWTGIFVFIGVVNAKWLIAENLTIYSSLNSFIGLVANIILNWILIPIYGISGAALATLISYSLSAYLCLYIWPKTRAHFYLISSSFGAII